MIVAKSLQCPTFLRSMCLIITHTFRKYVMNADISVQQKKFSKHIWLRPTVKGLRKNLQFRVKYAVKCSKAAIV